MSSTSGPGQSGPPRQGKAPYAPRFISLGGQPAKIPDIPITTVFLFLYLIFAVIHIKIMKYNKDRGHKFVFNGALFGFCKVRLITMSMRIAWACYPTNISLAIAAQVFVNVGTIILYLCNWFFTQRVVRAQHPRFGWSVPYRIVHRGGMIALIVALLIIIIASIQQFFTLDGTTLRVDRNLQLAAFTYFAAFTLAPLALLAISFIIPRRGTEKFGAGRLRNAITVLLIGSLIMAFGQWFRTVTGWLPQIPLRNAQGRPNTAPWYLSRPSFYVFNFVTEILVVILYAVMRVDLRFYVPDGARKPGDYRAYRESQFHMDIIGNEKRLKRSSGTNQSIRSVISNETLHEYEASVFEDTHTLADSLRFQSTIMEVDDRTGNWKIKRQSKGGSVRSSLRPSNRAQSPLRDSTRDTLMNGAVPAVPSRIQTQDWPLRESQLIEHRRNRSSSSPNGSSRLRYVSTPDIEKSDAINMAMEKLESHGAPPEYDFVAPSPPKKTYQPGSDLPSKKDHYPTSPTSGSTYTTADSDLSAKKEYGALSSPTSPTSPTSPRREPSSSSSNSNKTSINTEATEKESARFSFEGTPDDSNFKNGRDSQGRHP